MLSFYLVTTPDPIVVLPGSNKEIVNGGFNLIILLIYILEKATELSKHIPRNRAIV